MNLFRALRGSATRRTAAATRRPTRPRLGLEPLECREVPAALLDPSQPYVNFLNSGKYSVGASTPLQAAVGSFNGAYDTIPDVVTANADGSISVLLGKPTGGFQSTPNFPGFPGVAGLIGPFGIAGQELKGQLGSTTTGIVAGDFNGDGFDDLAVASYGSGNPAARVTVLLGSGLGTFAIVDHLTLAEDPRLNNARTPGATYMAVADMDKDGRSDLVVSDYNNDHVLVYRGQGDGTFQLHDFNYTPNGVSNPNQLVVADLNGDGILDVAVANNGNGSVSVFRGLGDGYITAAGNFSLLAGAQSIGLAAGDLDGDGRTDLAVASYSGVNNVSPHGVLTVLRNTGTGGGFAFNVVLNKSLGRHLVNVVAADFDRDGKVDLAVTAPGEPYAPENNMYVMYNVRTAAGQTKFATPIQYYTNVGRNPFGLLTADFNRDGKTDLLTVNSMDGTVSLFLRNR